jgi:hypothetical protein
MFSKYVKWVVWSIGGLVLMSLMWLHFSGGWVMPDYLILTIGICSGMYLLMFLDALTEELIGNKK